MVMIINHPLPRHICQQFRHLTHQHQKHHIPHPSLSNRQRHRHACLRRRPHRRPRYPHSCHHPFRLSCRQHRHRRTRPHRPQRLFHGFRVSFLLRCLLMHLRRCPASNPLTHQRLLLLRRYLRRLLQLRSLRHGALGSCSAAVLKTRIGTCSGNINM